MRVKCKEGVPRGEWWKLTHPSTGAKISALSWDTLLNRVKAHHEANNLPIGLEFERQVEMWVCQSMVEEEVCVETLAGKPIRRRKLSLSDVIRGTRVLLAFKTAGSPIVDQATAEARAKICASCSWNLPFEKPCGGVCGELAEMAGKIIGNHHTSHDGQLHACALCHCRASLHVWLPMEVLIAGMGQDMKDQFREVGHCWKKT